MAIVTYCSGGHRWTEWLPRRGPSPEPAGAIEYASWHHQPDPAPEAADPPTDRLQLGAHAKQLLDDPVLALAFDKLTEDLAAAWRDSKLGEGEKRDDAYRMVKAIEAVKSRLQALADNAKVLQAEQERREKEDERKRAA